MPAKVVLDEIDTVSPGGTVISSTNIIVDGSTLNNYIILPSGTNAERINVNGSIRWNSEIGAVEYYNGVKWKVLAVEGEYENISRAGMVIYIDSEDLDSYSRSGTGVSNLTKWSIISAELTNGVAFSLTENAFSFDSLDDYILLGDQFFTEAMKHQDGATYSFWFKANSGLNFGTGDAQKLLFSVGDGTQSLIRIGVAPNGGIFYADSGNNTVFNSAVNYNDDNWHNLTLVRSRGSSTSVVCYVDYTQIGTLNNTNPRYDIATSAAIGASIFGSAGTYTTSDYFGGLISSIIIHDRALTTAQIQQNYNAFSGRYI